MDYAFLPQPMQQALKQRWLLPALSALFLLSALLTLWNNVSTLWLAPSNTDQTPFRAPNIINVQQLAQNHVLGAAENMSDLPLASLGITLKGIFYDSQNSATAVVGQADSTTNYHDGDQLAPGIVIVKILPTSVIIRHNGNLEKLAMPIQPIEFSQTQPSNGLWNNP